MIPASCSSGRASEKARTEPSGSASSAGMRKTGDRSIPGEKTSTTVTVGVVGCGRCGRAAHVYVASERRLSGSGRSVDAEASSV